jgi:hypothetical protein
VRTSIPLSRRWTSTALLAAAVALGTLQLFALGTASFAFGDYEVEALPAVQALAAGHLHEFVLRLPGYGGATLLQSPFLLGGSALGGDLGAFRAAALPGLGLLAGLGWILARRLLASGAGRGWAVATALALAGSPIALLALQAGHPEELLVAGLAVTAVLLAIHGRPLAAAAAIGAAAAAKPWALIAVPIVLLPTPDWRTVARQLLACGVAAALVLGPIVAVQHADRGTAAPVATQATGIFKPMNLFWFAGRSDPAWRIDGPAVVQHVEGGAVSYNKPSQQRIEPGWVGRVTHPLVVVAAFAIALLFARRRTGAERKEDLLLLLAAVGWWRCLLDSWNVGYYALCAGLALVAWSAWRGRAPLPGLLLLLGVWVSFELLPERSMSPDLRTAVYLAWALPAGVVMTWRALAPASFGRLAGTVRRRAARVLPTLTRELGAPVA